MGSENLTAALERVKAGALGEYDDIFDYALSHNPISWLPDLSCIATQIENYYHCDDGDEIAGLFILKDGRYLFLEGSCDYTGWD